MAGIRGLARTVKVVAAVAVLLVGAVGGAYLLGVVGAPSVVGVQNRFGDVSEEHTVIRSTLVVNNPNPVGVRLGGVSADYAVSLNGIRMASGSKSGLAVEQGNFSVPFRTRMNNSKIPAWWVSHVRNGEHTTLQVDASVHSSLLGRSFSPQITRDVNTSIISAFRSSETRPLNASSPLVSDPVLYLNRTEAQWGTVDNDTTEVEMTLHLYNPKSYPVTLSTVGYNITMNNISMGGGEAGEPTTIPPGETVAVPATTVIDTQKLDEWWVSHLQRNQVTQLRVSFYLVFDLSAAGAGEQRIDLTDVTRTVETDMFGTKNESATGTSGSAAAGSGGDGTATATPAGAGTDTPAGTAGGGDTATPGTTPTPTPAPTETPGGTATPSGGTTTTDDGLFTVDRSGLQ
ncbi:LEA type 2 family protein [Halobaculum sp. D14]|uniref:LEA type 2 family protein n=1 Tax=Halobaculum sp. D14 TaxID=3421642 RepID=UPI003EBAEBE7